MDKTFKLLLIDDDKLDRSAFRRYLNTTRISYDIQECAYGKTGIDEFEKGQFDWVFVDYNLPDINGIEVVEKILDTDPDASIVIMTGEGDELLAAKAIKCGASDYLPKNALSSIVLTQCIQNLELRKAKVEAEQNNRAKTEFLARMSHELRTPMNAILGFSQLMHENTKDPLSESHQFRVSQILKAGRHLLNLINDMLDLSHIESEKLSLSIEPICIANLLEDLISLARPLSEQSNIVLIDNTYSPEEIFVLGDKTRLKQVLLNLISNGIKYNRSEGSVTLTIEIQDADYLRINVKDTGVGIPNEKIDYVFEPFDRLGAENSEIEGTGIGLTISKKLIEAMNGSIGLETSVGEGSEFYIILPISVPTQLDQPL